MKKPPHGDPCNGCGLCCQNELCPLGAALFQTWDGPCPALMGDGDRLVCGLVRDPRRWAPMRAAIYGVGRLRRAALLMIGASIGCDAQIADEPYNERFGARLRQEASRQQRSVGKALIMWCQLPPPEYPR